MTGTEQGADLVIHSGGPLLQWVSTAAVIDLQSEIWGDVKKSRAKA